MRGPKTYSVDNFLPAAHPHHLQRSRLHNRRKTPYDAYFGRRVRGLLAFFFDARRATAAIARCSAEELATSQIVITDQDNGKDIDLPAGGSLVVRLNSNPSTGYSWTIKGDPSPLRLVKSSTKKNSQTGHAVGAPVMQQFRLTAVSAGMASLTLEYRRPWEYNVAPARTFKVRVNAR